MVIEPIAPDQWATDRRPPVARRRGTGNRWTKLADHARSIRGRRSVKLEDYERTLRPQLVDSYARGGYC